MGSYTWTVPSPAPDVSSPSSGGSSSAAGSGRVFGFFDQEVDPVSRDYIDTSDGAWSETEDSRTAVLMQLEIRYGEWFADPEAGSRIKAMLESGDPITTEELLDEVRRALQLLVLDGIITDLVVDVLQDDASLGKLTMLIIYRDRASGRPVDLVYSPFAEAA